MCPFEALTNEEIETGEPVKASTLTKVQENFDDHESRLQNVEGSVSDFPPIILRVNGPYGSFPVRDNVTQTTANFTFNIIGARILVDLAGSSGTLEIDIKKKRGAGAWESIFSTKPQAGFGSGDNYLSTNQILDGTKTEVQAGDILRLDITGTQVEGIGFLVRIDYNRS